MTFVDALPTLNAALNATSAVFLISGIVAIKRQRPALHQKLMLAAFGSSSLFLVFYLTRFALAGSKSFPGTGPLKVVYLGILFSHMILAMVVVPMVLRSIYLALVKKQFVEHRKMGRLTFPVWAYVSLTGVIVYVMLYRLPV